MRQTAESISGQRSSVAALWEKNTVVMCLVAVILLVHAGMLGYSATLHSPTVNEPGHLVAGLTHWRFGQFNVYRVNPPLVHYVSAIPVMLAGYEEDWSDYSELPAARPEYRMGTAFVKANGNRSAWLITLARWACIPFSLLGGLFCFRWSRELWGNSVSGLVSLTAWCFEPMVLAHGELITSDCAAASLGVGAGYMFWRWLDRPTWRRALAAGLVMGLAELTKTSWVILFVLWPLLSVVWLFMNRHRKSSNSFFRSLRQVGFILIVAIYVLNLGYGFDGSMTRLNEFTFVSRTLTGRDKAGIPGNRFKESEIGRLPVPVPASYLSGIDVQKMDFERFTKPSYLRGEWRDGGWWYYYIYGLTIKTTLSLQCLILLSFFTSVYLYRSCADKNRRAETAAPPPTEGSERHALNCDPPDSPAMPPDFRRARMCDLVVLWAPAIVIMMLVSSQLEFNQHVRYVLPALGFAIVSAGGAAWWFVPATPDRSAR